MLSVHKRISLQTLTTYNYSFDEDFALLRALGVRWAGLLLHKLSPNPPERLGILADAGISPSTILVEGFSLLDRSGWGRQRDNLCATIDMAEAHGAWSIYTTPGSAVDVPVPELTDILAEAVKPCVDHARGKAVRLAFEPSLRHEHSFVHSIRDAIPVAQKTGLGIVVDFGNCWMEADFAQAMADAADHIALLQICDAAALPPNDGLNPRAFRRVPIGDGLLPIHTMMRALEAAHYRGPVEFELPGMAEDRVAYGSLVPRAIASASELLERLQF